MTDFLSVPLKKSSDVDLVKPLKNLLASLYSTSETPQDFTTSIQELNKLRSQTLSKTLDKSLPALEILYRYHDQIASLETKIPQHEVQITFKWKDAFDRGSLFGGRVSLSLTSLAYEKSCILFNIAAMQGQIASLGRISDTDEELKSAAKLFQSSSGIFTHLKSAASCMGGQEPTPDLNSDTLSALSALMLAQAQEIFVTKAIQDKMKDAIIAKLCVQAEDLYSEALRLMQKDAAKHVFDKEWLTNCSGKQTAFSGLAQFFQSQVCGQNKQVGEQIARLNLSIELLKQAQQRSGNTNLYHEYVAKTNRLLTDAKKDNDFIYHERVPDSSSLSSVDKVASMRLAKSIPVPETFSSHFKDLFEALVPVTVHQAMTSCDVKKTEIVNSRIGSLREASQLLNSILASLNLPAALEDATSASDDVPISLKEKAKFIKDQGGASALCRMINEMPELVQRNKELLDEAERLIREEEDSDNQLRAQLKEKWSRTPSEKLTTILKTNGSRYREIINNALSADQIVKDKYEKHRMAIEMLSGGEDALVQHLPKDSNSNKSTGSVGARDNLRQLMIRIDGLKAQRESLENELKTKTFDMRSSFLNALSDDGAMNEPAISAELLGNAYGPLEKKVKESLELQENLVVEIQRNSDEYFGRSDGGKEGKRENLMRQLAEGFDAYNELESNIREGTKFYNDLTQLLLQYQSKITDFCFARKTEKEELLKDVTRDASSVTIQSAPPRPPQPSNVPNTQPQHNMQPQQQFAGPMQPPPAYNPQMGMHTGQPQYGQNYGTMPMPMPFQQQTTPYPQYTVPQYTPMPMGYNPYATYPGPGQQPQQNYPYPVQPMGYQYPPQQQQQQQPPGPQ